jgi:hypothetical protein
MCGQEFELTPIMTMLLRLTEDGDRTFCLARWRDVAQEHLCGQTEARSAAFSVWPERADGSATSRTSR